MLYVQQSLAPHETLIHVGRFHWIYNVKAVLNIITGIVVASFIIWAGIFVPENFDMSFLGGYSPDPDAGILTKIRSTHPIIRIAAFIAFLLGVAKFAQMMIVKATTEIAVTSSRIIYKRGVVARYVGEMAIDRIEGVNVLQTFFGRILNYGRVLVRGMGIGEVVLPIIENPVIFRKAIDKARAVSQRNSAGSQDFS